MTLRRERGTVPNRARTLAERDRAERSPARPGRDRDLVRGATPRFAYTIGLGETLGAELVLGGGVHFLRDDLLSIMGATAVQLRGGESADDPIDLAGRGSFTRRHADRSR